MPLQRIRRTMVRHRLRAAVRPRVLLGLAQGLAAGIALAGVGLLLHLPEEIGKYGGMILVAALVARQTRRADERAWRAEQLLPRRPREIDPAVVARPQPQEVRRGRRWMVGLSIPVFVVWLAMIGGGAWALTTPHVPLSWFQRVLMAGGVAGLTWSFADEARRARKAFTAMAALDVPAMPRHTVRVIGFTGAQDMEIAIEPVEPGITSDGSPVAVLAQGRGLRDVVLGDVLVCDGEPVPDGLVKLSTPDGSGWSWKIRALTSDERRPSVHPIGPDRSGR